MNINVFTRDISLTRNFSIHEKISIYILGFGFFLPVSMPFGKLILPEVAMALYIVLSRGFHSALTNVSVFLIFFYVPLIVEYFDPIALFPFTRNLLVCFKFTLFIFFIYIFVKRSSNPYNVGWLIRNFLFPLSILLTASFVLDFATANPFFAKWHSLFSTKSDAYISMFSDVYDMDKATGNGFLTRSADIIPWAFIGMISVLWLFNNSLIKKRNAFMFLMYFIGVILFLPKRSGLFVLLATVLLTLLMGGFKLQRSISFSLLFSLFIAFIAVQSFYSVMLESGSIDKMNLAGAYNRLVASELGDTNKDYDDRITLGYELIIYLLDTPRRLLLGAGWDSASNIWVKPHSTLLATILGGGLVGFITIITGILLFIKSFKTNRNLFLQNNLFAASIIALVLYYIGDSAFFYTIEYPGSLLVLWLTLSIIVYSVPSGLRCNL